jgi:hypothetical protein
MARGDDFQDFLDTFSLLREVRILLHSLGSRPSIRTQDFCGWTRSGLWLAPERRDPVNQSSAANFLGSRRTPLPKMLRITSLLPPSV